MVMSLFRHKKALILFGLLIIISSAVIIFTQKSKQPVVSNSLTTTQNTNKKDLAINVDFNGDGVNEVVKVTEDAPNRINMEAYNAKGDKIATLWDGIPLYPTSLYKVINLSTTSNKQYLQWNMAVGPHQVETVFLSLVGDLIHPIYSFDFEKKTMYSPFYTSRGEIVVGDANNDGLSEVIENVDEYPVDAPRLEDPKTEQMIRDEFTKSGLPEEIIKSNIDIVTRENYGKGRGRKVIMAIHSFVDSETPFFRKLPKTEYEEIAGRLVAASIDIEKGPDDTTGSWEDSRFLRYSELSQNSKNFNSFVRDFWTHGRPFESPVSD